MTDWKRNSQRTEDIKTEQEQGIKCKAWRRCLGSTLDVNVLVLFGVLDGWTLS